MTEGYADQLLGAAAFPWASSLDSDFNFDFSTSFTEDQQRSGSIDYNFTQRDTTWSYEAEGTPLQHAAMTGTDTPTYLREAPGMSAFVLDDGAAFHTYLAYARGLDGLWGMYQWLDRAPLGRNENGAWWRSARRIPSRSMTP